MSRHVKYISSEHYDAPQLLGDRWGYGVEMLRKCLCEGFNERIDITDIEVLDKDHVKITYDAPHRYVAYQTIAVKGAALFELNNEYFIESVTALTVTAKSYINLTSLLNLKLSNLSTVSSKVAPLGFIEKFRDGNKSAFTTDEEEAFFVIDDTQPTAWNATAVYTQLISPLVYMTDKMTDINTDGKYIVPYDTNNPTYYKTAHTANVNRNGLWAFITFGVNDYNGNSAAYRRTPQKYTIIGNGRFFYFLPDLKSHASGILTHIYAFGKFNSIKNNNMNDHILIANNIQEQVYTNYERLEPYCMPAIANYTDTYYSINLPVTGRYNHAVLTYNNSTEAVTFSPGYYINISSLFISGSLGNYPDKTTGNIHLSYMNIHSVNTSNKLGSLPGYLYVYNINKTFFNNRMIKSLRHNNRLKDLYVLKSIYHSTRNRDTNTTQFLYFISLDYSDWNNYD
jgi:hypothetical protein